MEALHSHLTTGEQSGDQEHYQPESPHQDPQPKSPSQHSLQQQIGPQKPHELSQQPKPSRRQHPDRKRLRHQRQSVSSSTAQEGKHADAATTKKTTMAPCSSTGVSASATTSSTKSKQETQEGTPKQKRERKPQRPGKYVCTYCGRACAKPSVLQKHVRSHTGERPYPCVPCGFSFKTKSNLYKHRKSHTHRVKAGLALGESRPLEDQESEDDTRQLSSATSSLEKQNCVSSLKSNDPDKAGDRSGGTDDSYAVKKRLAMRLSRGKHGPLDCPDEKTSSLVLGSRGSTESGYFSRSESTEQSQDSPPNTSAKSYAEIILGKYGRLGQLQRMCRNQNQQPSGKVEKNIPFTVPKKQVIDHITKLITINEAVVDTSKIDSVKPRRFSLSRKNSTESQKGLSIKESIIHKERDSGYKNSGSITMGVPCEKFYHQAQNVEPPGGQTTTAPLLRSHSMPSAASLLDAPHGSPCRFRLSQSFDERKLSEMQTSRRYGMLRRQPAIEIPLGAEPLKEEVHSSHLFYHDNITTVPDHKQIQPQPYECEACGTGCKDWKGYKTHKQSQCLAQHPSNTSEVATSQMDCPQLLNHPIRPGGSVMRKRRKEESFEFDDPSPFISSSPSPAVSSGPSRDEINVPRRPTLQTFSVIQHTSSFEKQENLCTENQSREAVKSSPPHEEYQAIHQKQQSTKPTPRKLVRQHNVQVPEILVTEDSNTNAKSLPESTSKQSEKLDEFQWPQRSPTLAQLPIEKLPPKKKRLRLAEATQSSGESSFDSTSLPHSPSQDSSASYASSRSASFEESTRLDMEKATSATPLRRSRAPHMLTVPGVHQHREMRRSASEQAPHDPQQGILMSESRSKSFDYSCLSPERSAIGWRERRKCLLVRHNTVRDPDEEEEEEEEEKEGKTTKQICDPVVPSTSSMMTPSAMHCSRPPSSPLSGDAVLCNPVRSQHQELFSRWKGSQNIQFTGSAELPPTDSPTVNPVKDNASPIHTGQPPGLSLTSVGAAMAHYLPIASGLKLEIPTQRHKEYSVQSSPSQPLTSLPNITSSTELLRPPTSPVVAVRLQADTQISACAIYTTLSQIIPFRPGEPLGAVSSNTTIPISDYCSHRDLNAEFQVWFEDGLRSSSSGGNKRMLSPSNSIELHPESQQQQKRVKEEEESKHTSADASNEEDKQVEQTYLPGVCSPIRHNVFPSLQSSTCNSWCYLNYIKPNPSLLDEQKPSVYSTWSTSSYDPNPLGLSSKTALSLLHCKQRLSSSIYTMSSMSDGTTEPMEPEQRKRPCSTEVHNRQSCDRDHVATLERQPSTYATVSVRGKAEEESEEVQPPYRYKRPPQVWICEGGANEKYGHAGEGGEKDCGVCGAHCEDAGEPWKHTCSQTDPSPYVCKHCRLDSETKVTLTEHMRSNAAGEKHEEKGFPLDNTDEGVCDDYSAEPDEYKRHQHSDLETREDAGEGRCKNDDGDEDKVSQSADNPPRSASHYQDQIDPGVQTRQSQPQPSQSLVLTTKDPAQKSTSGSATARRALFACQHLDTSKSIPSRSPGSPSETRHPPPAKTLPPERELSPSRSPLPRPPSSPAPCCDSRPHSLSPSSCHPSTSAQCQATPLPTDRPTTAMSKTRLDTPTVDGTSRTLFSPQCVSALPQGGQTLLSHLPLHSQQPTKAHRLMIPLGGIHMVQRGTTPLYSLVSSPMPTLSGPRPARKAGPSEPPAVRFSLLQRQHTVKEMNLQQPQAMEANAGREDEGSSQGRSSALELLSAEKETKPSSPDCY